MFTLALCLITIWIIDAVKAKISNKVLWYSISIVVVGISCAVAMALSLDYDYHAIIVAYIFIFFMINQYLERDWAIFRLLKSYILAWDLL